MVSPSFARRRRAVLSLNQLTCVGPCAEPVMSMPACERHGGPASQNVHERGDLRSKRTPPSGLPNPGFIRCRQRFDGIGLANGSLTVKYGWRIGKHHVLGLWTFRTGSKVTPQSPGRRESPDNG